MYRHLTPFNIDCTSLTNTVHYSAITTLKGALRAEDLAAAMGKMEPKPSAIAVIEIEDGSGTWEVAGYFQSPPDPVNLALLEAAYKTESFLVSHIPETDWVTHVHRNLKPVHIRRFWIHGSHVTHEPPADAISLKIEASTAFGTGHHQSTAGCLHALDHLVTESFVPNSVCDLGCGTAVLAMAAAHCWPSVIVASDIEDVSIDVAIANVQSNNLGNRIQCIVADGLNHPIHKNQSPYDLIFANILYEPLIALAPDFAQFSKVNSRLVLSGFTLDQRQKLIRCFASFDFRVREQIILGEWCTIIFARN